MITNIHFHPNGKYAAKFVAPLIDAENASGFNTCMINSINSQNTSYESISYDLTAKNLVSLPLSLFKIIRLIKRIDPDCIVSHNTRSSLIPLLAAKLLNIKNIIYFNHGVPYLGYSGLTGSLLKLLEYINCFLASAIITISNDMVIELKKITNKKVNIIGTGSACGIDSDIYSKKKYRNKSFKKKLSINSKDIVFVFIGRPEKRKGYYFLINLWVKHFANKPHHKLILCGIDYEDLEKNLNEAPNNIIPLGFVDYIPEILSSANCLILPSLHEGLSYAILEAMACECLVIANDIPGLRCLVKDSFNGYLIRTNDEKEYVKKMSSIKKDNELIKNALKTAKLFNRKKHIKSYMEFMKQIKT